jgi:hypothetical protein
MKRMNQVKPPLPPHYTLICVLCLRLIFLYFFFLQMNPRQPPSLRVPPRQPPRGKSTKNPPWEGFERGTSSIGTRHLYHHTTGDLKHGNKAPLPPHYNSICLFCMRSLLLYLVLPRANEAKKSGPKGFRTLVVGIDLTSTTRF